MVVVEAEIISDPSFTSAFWCRVTVWTGLVSEAPVVPVIHVNEDELRAAKMRFTGLVRTGAGFIGWPEDSYLTVAKAFKSTRRICWT